MQYHLRTSAHTCIRPYILGLAWIPFATTILCCSAVLRIAMDALRMVMDGVVTRTDVQYFEMLVMLSGCNRPDLFRSFLICLFLCCFPQLYAVRITVCRVLLRLKSGLICMPCLVPLHGVEPPGGALRCWTASLLGLSIWVSWCLVQFVLG